MFLVILNINIMEKEEIKFKYLVVINSLGSMYGSAGGFLSPENLVGRSRAKFPPDAATLSGLFLSFFKSDKQKNQPNNKEYEQIKQELHIAGPFWNFSRKNTNLYNFFVPIPWHKIISDEGTNEWILVKNGKSEWQWQLKHKEIDIKPEYQWQKINSWEDTPESILKQGDAQKTPWRFVPQLHPHIKLNERNVLGEDGLFLENTIQMPEDICLIYLSTHDLEEGWYRFGGENHLVEIETKPLVIKKETKTYSILNIFEKPIEKDFALISPGVWGSKKKSYRYPQHSDFPQSEPLMLTDKPVPYRFRLGGRLSRGRYAVPPGSVYVLDKPLNQQNNTWGKWPSDWFPIEGKKDKSLSLKNLGCGLCLPVNIERRN